MRFFLDHDIPAAVSRHLSQAGHSVLDLREVLPVAADDEDVLAFAHRENRFLITCNRNHFLRLAANQPNFGLIIMVRRGTRVAECRSIQRCLDRAGEEGLRGNINFA